MITIWFSLLTIALIIWILWAFWIYYKISEKFDTYMRVYTLLIWTTWTMLLVLWIINSLS